MKTLGEAALELPWLAPSATSLTTLARLPLGSVWSQVRTDPGIVLLLARSHQLPASEPDISLLDAALQQLQHADVGFVDWNQPGPNHVYRASYHHALLVSRLVSLHDSNGGRARLPSSHAIGSAGASPSRPAETDEGDRRAWIAGFLAPLGWLALTAADPQRIGKHLDEFAQHPDPAGWQRRLWVHDHSTIARRLARSWRLPIWLTAIVGQLGLHASIAERLGADTRLFQFVQLVAHLLQQRECGLGIVVGTPLPELLTALRLSLHDVGPIADEVARAAAPIVTWESPAKQPLLADLLHLAIEQRRRNDAGWIERLQQDVDRMQEALVTQSADDERRLQAMKLSSLAEFAAGAGHEINNPLAVISGQAQYVLKQMDWLDGPADEIENVGEYLDHLRTTITPSLRKIIAQTQRIHAILTELMQFARPGPAKLQTFAAGKLIRETAEALRPLAREHEVELDYAATEEAWLHADPAQACVALAGLLKNAIEAAPAGGWARVRAKNDRPGLLDLIVEDNGHGVAPAVREHLFDPFYSGRSAGRGRGMGLPTAWRLARQQGGEVRFEGADQGVTRFVLTLPMALVPPAPNDDKQPAHSSARNGTHRVVEVGS